MGDIIKIKISEEEYSDILKYITISEEVVFFQDKNASYLQVNKESFENILDNLSSYLMKYGIDENGEINAIGYDVERMIDKLSIVYEKG